WAMVPLEYYDDAYEYMFIDREEPNASLVKKINAYKKLQKSASSILTDAQKAGIDVSVVAMWDLQLLPIGNDYMSSESGNDERDINDMSNELYGLSAQSDGFVDTYFASFGGFCTAIDNSDRASLITQSKDIIHNHLSSNYSDSKEGQDVVCHYIDASACILPENSYFIRNMKHGSFREGSTTIDFICRLACTDDTNINSEEEYGQFMSVDKSKDPLVLVVDSDIENVCSHPEEDKDICNKKEPSCTENGYSGDIVCTKCGTVLEKGDETPALGHFDNDKDGICDRCKEVMPAVENCGCICHDDGLGGFLYKIIKIIWRIFGVKKICACGVAHY
ncbi:MAG: hypothetical protein PUG93_03115, partial [Oscillospiraceae bacterium]|nr:hypothetical protein [Oscillospiraceae bacterium]